ncbi:MAG: hypothetical protein AAF206_22285 [Bacteroidota bacterium]
MIPFLLKSSSRLLQVPLLTLLLVICSNGLLAQSAIEQLRVQWYELDGEIYWTMTTSSDLSHFEIDRSVNGVDFAMIGRMDPHHDSKYMFADKNADRLDLKHWFYRIRPIGKDTIYAASPVLRLEKRMEYKPIVISFPSVFNDKLSISYQVNRGQIRSLIVQDKLGKAFAVRENPRQRGRWAIASSEWPDGTYYLKLQTDQQKRVYKLQKE